jgi:general secretion pathway protein J
MKKLPRPRYFSLPLNQGFTLVELLVVLLIFSLLALMSYRGLGAVLDARAHVKQETEKWRRVSTFFSRFESDVHLASRRPVRTALGNAPAWRGDPGAEHPPYLEFSRFSSADGVDTALRVAYTLNDKKEIELLLWPGLDVAPGTVPQHYPVLRGVDKIELKYLNAGLVWMDTWPIDGDESTLPRAVQLRIVLDTSEEVVRVFAL